MLHAVTTSVCGQDVLICTLNLKTSIVVQACFLGYIDTEDEGD